MTVLYVIGGCAIVLVLLMVLSSKVSKALANSSEEIVDLTSDAGDSSGGDSGGGDD